MKSGLCFISPPKKAKRGLRGPATILLNDECKSPLHGSMNREEDARAPLYRVNRQARGAEAQRVRGIVERHRTLGEFMVPIEHAQNQVRRRLPIQARAHDPAEP